MKKLTVVLLLLALFTPALFAQSDRGPQIAAMTFTIALGESLSGEVSMRGCTPTRIIMPASGWDAANLTFQVGDVSGTVANLYDEFGSEVTVTAAAARIIRLNPADWWGFRQMKIRSGTSGTAVNQTAARTITVVCAITK